MKFELKESITADYLVLLPCVNCPGGKPVYSMEKSQKKSLAIKKLTAIQIKFEIIKNFLKLFFS